VGFVIHKFFIVTTFLFDTVWMLSRTGFSESAKDFTFRQQVLIAVFPISVEQMPTGLAVRIRADDLIAQQACTQGCPARLFSADGGMHV
jgi:hypothetical protein